MSHRVVELHCIMPINNLTSVLQVGILSHERAERVAGHASVAMQEIQDLRHTKTVPGGYRLHQYANLYFCARNPMLYKRMAEHSNLCVIRLSTQVLSGEGVVISDQNAASKYVRFHSYPDGMRFINFDYVFADSWQDDDQITAWRKKACKCAETLIPNYVDPQYITGFYTCNDQTKQRVEALLASLNSTLPVVSNPQFFFR